MRTEKWGGGALHDGSCCSGTCQRHDSDWESQKLLHSQTSEVSMGVSHPSLACTNCDYDRIVRSLGELHNTVSGEQLVVVLVKCVFRHVSGVSTPPHDICAAARCWEEENDSIPTPISPSLHFQRFGSWYRGFVSRH